MYRFNRLMIYESNVSGIDCTPTSVGAFIGGEMSVSCTLFNVANISILNISKDGVRIHSLQSPTTHATLSNMNVVISTTTINVTINMTDCSVEGSYIISINNGTTATFTAWMLGNY